MQRQRRTAWLAAIVLAMGLVACDRSADPDNARPHAELAPPVPGDWPMFRGDAALSGVAEGRLPPSLDLAWSFQTQGPLVGSPVIHGGRVYIGSTDGHAYAIDLASGEPVWKQPVGEPEHPTSLEAPALVHDGRVYIGGMDGWMYVLASDDGRILHRLETGAKITGSANYLALPDGGGLIVFGSYDARLYAIDADTAEPRWTIQTDDRIHGAAAVIDGQIMFAGCDGVLRIVDAAEGTQRQAATFSDPVIANPVVRGDLAVVAHHGQAVACVDWKSGKVQWRYTECPEPIFASPAWRDGLIVIAGQDGSVHAIDAARGTQRWASRARDQINSSPVIADGKVVFGCDDGRVYMLSADDGRALWSYEIGEPIAASPALGGGRLVIAATDGRLYAFEESASE